jgi:8-oxo-dGTP pyrophosphatase MutT (NUDIX family)
MWVTEDQVATEHGKKITYGVVHKNPFALIIPWDGSRFILVGQYRYPVDVFSWEFPQGTVEGKTMNVMAVQELHEETGYTAGRMEYKTSFLISPGHHTQTCHVFMAFNLTPGTPEPEETEEGLMSKGVTPEELREMMTGGMIQDAMTLAAYGLLVARRWISL